MKEFKLNIGCGHDYKDDYENWDISPEVRADRFIDITDKKWPIDDGKVDEIYISGVLEQILENMSFRHVLNEMHRVLKSGGKAVIVVPDSKYSITFRDPMDCRHFLQDTFKYFEEGSHEHKNYGSVYRFKPWKIVSRETNKRGIMKVVLEKP